MKITGNKRSFGIATETARGVENSANARYIATETIDAGFNLETIEDTSSAGTLADASDLLVVGGSSAITVGMKGGLNTIGHLLRAVSGKAPTFTAGAVNEHKFNMSENPTQDSFTIVEANPIQDKAYSLGILEKFEASLSQKAVPQFSATFKAKKPENVSLAEVFNEEEILLNTGFEFQYGDTLSALTTNDKLCVRDFKFSVEKATIEEQCVSSDSIGDIINSTRSVTGTFEVAFENDAYQQDFMQNKQKAIRILFQDELKTGGIEIRLPKVKLSGAKPDGAGADVVVQKVDFKALLDKTTLEQITFLLKNQKPDGTY